MFTPEQIGDKIDTPNANKLKPGERKVTNKCYDVKFVNATVKTTTDGRGEIGGLVGNGQAGERRQDRVAGREGSPQVQGGMGF